MTKHTPGPWRISTGHSQYIVRDQGGIIGHAEAGSGEQVPEAEANARLIAAAPELLDALDRMAREVWACIGMNPEGARQLWGNTNYNIVETRVTAARAVIAKAEGRAP